jgi:hypothetical protein
VGRRITGPVLDETLLDLGTRLGVIIATTTSQNNNDTATPFNNTGDALGGKLILVQPDAACYIAVGETSAITAATTDVKLEANQLFPINLKANQKFLAAKAVSGTVNLQVRELT